MSTKAVQKSKVKAPRRTDVPRRYKDLLDKFPPRPIRNDSEFDRMCRTIERLMEIESPSRDQLDYLDLLSTLAQTYEDAVEVIPKASLAEVLGHLIESSGRQQADVARNAKVSSSTISDVLARRRSLSTENMRRLAEFFRVNVGLFVHAIAPGKTA